MKPTRHGTTRSPLGKARGLGSARDGVGHWSRQRITAIALVPLTVWFAGSLILHLGSDHATVIAWLSTPIVMLLMVLLLIAMFQHMALGLQVVIEDYVHSWMKAPALLFMRFSCVVAASAGIVALLHIAFGD